MAKKEGLKFPDDVCALWDALRGQGPLNGNESETGRIYQKLVADLTSSLRENIEVSAFYGSDDVAHDMVMQFLDAMVLGATAVRPERMQSLSILEIELRKYGSRQNSLCCYEINEVLRESLHKLEYAGKIMRVGPQGRYRNSTGFSLSGSEPKEQAPEECVRQIGRDLPMYGEKKRDDGTAGNRFLKPLEAENLILKALKACEKDMYLLLYQIQSLAVSHVRNLPQIVDDPYDTIETGSSDDAGDDEEARKGVFDAKEVEDDPSGVVAEAEESAEGEVEEEDPLQDDEGIFWKTVAVKASVEAIKRIWEGVEKMAGTEIFCLYSIPKWNPSVRAANAVKHPLRDFGEPNRVAEKSDRQRELFRRELLGLGHLVQNDDQEFIRGLQLRAVNYIYDNLIGRCTEKGLNPSL